MIEKTLNYEQSIHNSSKEKQSQPKREEIVRINIDSRKYDNLTEKP
jgi:hypothetical protein